MVAEVCRFYGWTVEYALGMPAVSFFAMVDSMRLIEAHEKLEACDIQAISICTVKYYEIIRSRYSNFLDFKNLKAPLESGKRMPIQHAYAPVIKAESSEAHHFMQSIFMAKKRGIARG